MIQFGTNDGSKLIGYKNGVPQYQMPLKQVSFTTPLNQPGTGGYGSTPNYGSSGGYGGWQQLWQESEAAKKAANKKNEERYYEALGINKQQYDEAKAGYQALVNASQDRYNRNMQLLEGMGLQQKADTRSDYENALRSGMAGLSSRGMAGTTSAGNMRINQQNQLSSALNRLQENLNRERIGYDTQLSGMTDQWNAQKIAAQNSALGGRAGIIERRTDEAPDMSNLIVQLAMQGNQKVAPWTPPQSTGGGYSALRQVQGGGYAPPAPAQQAPTDMIPPKQQQATKYPNSAFIGASNSPTNPAPGNTPYNKTQYTLPNDFSKDGVPGLPPGVVVDTPEMKQPYPTLIRSAPYVREQDPNLGYQPPPGQPWRPPGYDEWLRQNPTLAPRPVPAGWR